jgi:DNA-binding NtrC family response regulator
MKSTDSKIIGHPDRIGPFQLFLKVIALSRDPVIISGPVGSGKKRTARFLIESNPDLSGPVFTVNGAQFSEDLWRRTLAGLGDEGILVLENIQCLDPTLQDRFREWLAGKGGLFSETTSPPSRGRILATTTGAQDLWGELLYHFPFHLQLPALNEVIEDIPYHLATFLREKPIRYIRYFFLLKTFQHQWGGNLLELRHYLDQALAYYQSKTLAADSGDEEAVFGEKRLRFYQDVFRGEWWYYPYRFPPGFDRELPVILNQTAFRKDLIDQGLVIPLLKEETGFLVLDLKDPEFETKANRIYRLFLKYRDDQRAGIDEGA